jgi:hypothetical protein
METPRKGIGNARGAKNAKKKTGSCQFEGVLIEVGYRIDICTDELVIVENKRLEKIPYPIWATSYFVLGVLGSARLSLADLMN